MSAGARCQGEVCSLLPAVKPEYVRVTRGDGAELRNSSVIGPFTEGDELALECESGGGKPIPGVTWWNGTHRMAGRYSQEPSANGVGTGRSRLQLTLGRGDLGARYECRADSAALQAPITSAVEVEVNVRPLKLELSGLEHHVVQGTTVVLKCEVAGARPAAEVTWYNGTEALREDARPDTAAEPRTPKTRVIKGADGTFTTLSRLEFVATRFENGGVLSCKGVNPVMSARQEPPLEDTIPLEVLYPPIVYLRQDNVTRDEGQDFHLFVNFTSNPNTLKAVRWYRDGAEVVPTPGRYEGSTVSVPNLTVRNASRDDQGVYTVVLENEIDRSETNDAIYVSIYFKPTVALLMEPSTHVRELDRVNITLVCRVESGNPDLLAGVRWYLEGELLKELPVCEGGGNDTAQMFCDVDPSRLMLENVERDFHGNYSCEGRNEAGWGPVSPEQELVVYYPPGPASLVYSPPSVVKKGSVTLNCSVEERGFPETSTFRWLRGSHHVQDATAPALTIQPVTLETQSNFTCLAYNEGGEGEPATAFIRVLAPPVFIERPPLYYGALMGARNVSVSCRVECSPLCAVRWYKDGVLLDESSPRYTVIDAVLPADGRSNDFESTLSTLVLNISAWPGGRLDRVRDNANYTCRSDGNAAGPGVQANATFRVEYPPENITVSKLQVNVIENAVPEKVMCTANGYPEAQYQWYKEGENSTMKGNALNLGFPLKRHHGGNYICEAFNRHGRITDKTFINVLYKPECAISQTDMAGKLVLVCTVHANPTDVDFTWRIKNENDTIEENIEKKGLQSHLTLDSYIENFRTYVCFANNSVGVSIPCEQDVTAAHLSWWGMEKENMIIIVAVVVGAIIMVLIVCVIIIIVCRRKRADDKYNNPVELEERENKDEKLVMNVYGHHHIPDGDASSRPAQAPPQPAHKWPLRPGVLVHVNGARRLGPGGPPPPHPGTAGRRGKKAKRRRAVSLGALASPDETNQHGRASRIRQMFSDGYRGDTLPGIIHSKSEVVTFKKLDGQSNHGVSRKRKKPGADPNPSAIKDKSKPDLMSSPNDGLLQPDGDKAFYENLPFHGMQTAPNKPVAPSFSSHVVSRPPSQLSHNGSSGYGSTRSHAGLFSGNKCNSLRVNRHKRGQGAGHFPRFYSLRLRKRLHERPARPEATESAEREDDGGFSLCATPIRENFPGEKDDVCEQNNNNNDASERHGRVSARFPAPVPAPRRQPPNKVVRHTYQNVPIPITPNSQDLTPKPFRPQYSDLDYADVDYRSYGPINYKKASLDAVEKQKPARPPKNTLPDLL
ncbi:hemicentin-1 [Bacillus rossius redtenbacheri]|uniref:hemicentin-1 n=1 Tax=Bacillus rossius redtenbacheri TaxID=93214 RepID=UPI002FDE25CB